LPKSEICAIVCAVGRRAEEVMKKIACLAMLLAVGATSIAPAIAAPVCLDVYYIDSSHVVDASTITFKMKNGTVWRNSLHGRCPGLLFNGFTYTLHDRELCGEMQAIRVLRTNEICLLGKFTKEVPNHT
jgi:hypothetical protein